MRYIMILLLLLAACGTDAKVECWDGTMVESADQCPPEVKEEPEPIERIIEEGLPTHGEYAQPEARQERREERKVEGEERLGIDIDETADHLEAGKERLGIDAEPVILEIEDLNGMVELEDQIQTEEILLEAKGTDTVLVLEENCESCIVKGKVEILEKGKDFGFGFVMKYKKGAMNNPILLVNGNGMAELHNVEYGEALKQYSTEMPDNFELFTKVSGNLFEMRADDEKVIRENSVGPLANGKAFGFYVRDGKVNINNLEFENWG